MKSRLYILLSIKINLLLKLGRIVIVQFKLTVWVCLISCILNILIIELRRIGWIVYRLVILLIINELLAFY